MIGFILFDIIEVFQFLVDNYYYTTSVLLY